MPNGNDNFTLQELLAGNLTINLDMEYSTLAKLMAGMILALVISAILTKAILK